MDQQKIGAFLKSLRKEKGLTQEQLAEKMRVSNRTISRWENGRNLPDISILMELSDDYGLDLREILNGERNRENMDPESKEAVLKAVEYTNTETERYTKRVHWLLLVGTIFVLVSETIDHTGLSEIYCLRVVSDFAAGAACGMLLCGVVGTSVYGKRLKAFKQRILKRKS